MSRIFLFLLISTLTAVSAAEFVHPGDFKGSQAEKDAVLAYIVEDTKERYSAIGMGDPMTLRMMEEENLRSFRALAGAKDRGLLDQVIRQYCSIGMCDYTTLNMMYNEQLRSSESQLTW